MRPGASPGVITSYSIHYTKLYEEALVLPSISITEFNDTLHPFIEGISLFSDDKLIGFLSADESMIYNIIKNTTDSCILTYNFDNTPKADISIKITKNDTKLSYSYKNNKFKVNRITSYNVCYTKLLRMTLLSVPFYILRKIPLYFAFVIKRQQSWVKTERR